MTGKLSSLKSLDGAPVNAANSTDQNPADIMWRRICQSQIKSMQSLRSAYLSDIKLVLLFELALCCTSVDNICSIIMYF